MGWSYKAPQTFPAQFFACIRHAIEEPGAPVLLGSDIQETNVREMAERFRWFKWCVKSRPDAHQEMFLLMEAYSLRTRIEDALGFHLWLTATPNTFAEFTRLNPELAFDLLPHCQ